MADIKGHAFHGLVEKHGIQSAERLAYIDFLLRFTGGLSRSDITNFFGLGDAAASKEISFYKAQKENNVDYDRVLRRNGILRETYQPLVDIDADTALGMLANGFNKTKLQHKPIIPYSRVGNSPKILDVDLVSKVTRAISSKNIIKCHYMSGSSSNHGERTLVPTTIFFDGISWMFRAFHRESNEFKCFNFSRLKEVEECPQDFANNNETIESDADWQLTTLVHLTLHPSLTDKKKAEIRQEYDLDIDQDEFVVSEKAALIYYLVWHWKIDTADTPDMNSSYNFFLGNGNTLKHLKCMENVFR
ncbi:WYL domain-containing protein [Alkalimarinus coralli]|uniref:WYL domain-containing protein n=1 Tax=Alkalimarinus coralli TaxID=2935863 RepID=UPI00202B6C8F|nr:WYL domain-containing protein [Alkalimarinus coralli]